MEIRKLEKGVYQLQLSTSKFIKEGRGEKKRMSDSEVGRDGKCRTYKRCRFAFSTFNWILEIQDTVPDFPSLRLFCCIIVSFSDENDFFFRV